MLLIKNVLYVWCPIGVTGYSYYLHLRVGNNENIIKVFVVDIEIHRKPET